MKILIAINGSSQAEATLRFLLDNVTHQILAHIDCPVLVARKRISQPNKDV